MIRRLAAAVAVVATAVIVAVGHPVPAQARPASEATYGAQSSPGTSGGASTSQIRLTDQTDWVANTGTFHLGLQVTTPDPTGDRLQVSVFRALPSRSDFTDSLSDRIHTSHLTVFDPQDLSSLGLSPDLTIAVNPASSAHAVHAIHLTASGVYPVQVELFDRSNNMLGQVTTHLVFSGADAATGSRLDVAWVAPFSAPPSAGAVPSDVAAGLTNLGSALAAHPTVAATVAATPETVEALSGGTANAKAATTQLSQALGNGTASELVTAPYVNLDLPSMLSAGLESEIGAQLATGTGVLSSVLHALPVGGTWIARGPMSPAAVDDLAGRGVQRIVFDDAALSPLPTGDRVQTPAQPFTVAGKTSQMAGLASDDALAAHFTDTGDQLLAAHQLLADLAMIQLELPNRRGGRGVVIVPPAGWQPNATFLATFLDGLATAPTLAPVPVDRVFSDVTPLLQGTRPVVRTVVAVPPARGQAIANAAAIRTARRPVASLRSELVNSTASIDEINRRILTSESADLSESARAAQLAIATKLIGQLKGLVRLPGNQSITFTARQGIIPITVLSRASYPVRVRIQMTSQKLGFRAVDIPGGSCTVSRSSAICTLVLRAQNTTLRVPVVAKTAGVFSITVAMDSADGGLNLATNQDTVRSTAASGVGVILSVGAVLLLAVWWVRDVRHGRRARRLVPTEAAVAVGGPAPQQDEYPFDFDLPAPRPNRPRPRPASGDDLSGLVTQPIPVIRADLPFDSPQPPSVPSSSRLAPGPAPRPTSRPAPPRSRPPLPPPPEPPGAARSGAPARSGPPAAVRTSPGASVRLVDAPASAPSEPTGIPPVASGDGRALPVASWAGRAPPAPGATGAAPAGADGAFSRNTVVMAAGTLLSRLTGFVKVLALIWAFGITTGLNDVYTVANTAPNILYDLVLGGILSATLVPVFVDYLNHDDPDEGWRAISAVVTAITVTLIALSAVFYLLAPYIIRFYLVLNNSANVGAERAIGTDLLHAFVPQLFLLGGIAVTTALLNARRRFAAAAFSPAVNNLVAIAAIVGARLVATSLTLPGFRKDQSAILILGLGTTAGYLFQFLVQLPPLLRAGFRLRPVWDLSHPAVRTVLRLSLWTFGSVVANQISFNLILVLADHKKGDVTVFNTAYQFFQLPYAIFAVSIASVITPELADHWAKRDLPGFRRQMAAGLRLTLAVLVPAAVGYVVLAQPFLRLVLHHGSFSSGDTHRVGSAVVLFAVGLPGFSAYLLLMRAYQAMQDTKSMFWLYLLENTATLVLAGALYPLMGVNGLALGWVAAYTVGSMAAFGHLRRRTQGLDGRAVGAGLFKIAAATAMMVLPVLALIHLLPGNSDARLLTQVGGGVVVGAVVYVAAARLLGVSELAGLLQRKGSQRS